MRERNVQDRLEGSSLLCDLLNSTLCLLWFVTQAIGTFAGRLSEVYVPNSEEDTHLSLSSMVPASSAKENLNTACKTSKRGREGSSSTVQENVQKYELW
jgi:hypothetical protein